MIKTVACFLLFAFLFLGCSKRYADDDVCYMFNPPGNRITGTWRLTRYYINGGDSTNFLFTKYVGLCANGLHTGTPCYQFGVIDFEVESYNQASAAFHYTINAIDASGDFAFVSNNSHIVCDFVVARNSPKVYNPFRVRPYNGTPDDWKIQELTNIKFKLSNTINDTAYIIEFEKR